jgi:hypothetical protein
MPFINNVSGKFGFGHPTVTTRGSIKFNLPSQTTQQYLDVTVTAIGAATATVEFWFKTPTAAFQRLVSTTTVSPAAGDFIMYFAGTGRFIAGNGTSGITASVDPSLSAWNHVAWVGTSGTSQELFLNGSRVGTGGSYNLNDSTFYIGGRQINLGFYMGYISNFRYVRGTAVYAGATYTVPTEPLRPIAGTELLLTTPYNYSYLEDRSPNNHVVNAHGVPDNPTADALNPFS